MARSINTSSFFKHRGWKISDWQNSSTRAVFEYQDLNLRFGSTNHLKIIAYITNIITVFLMNFTQNRLNRSQKFQIKHPDTVSFYLMDKIAQQIFIQMSLKYNIRTKSKDWKKSTRMQCRNQLERCISLDFEDATNAVAKRKKNDSSIADGCSWKSLASLNLANCIEMIGFYSSKTRTSLCAVDSDRLGFDLSVHSFRSNIRVELWPPDSGL